MNSPSRSYRSVVRAEQAAATQQRIADAAAEMFARQGYGATSVAAVAGAAGVSAQTVYNAFGTKPELLKAAYDRALVGDAEPVALADRPEVRQLYALTDPAAFLRGYAALGRRILARVGPLLLQVSAGAASGDPDLVAFRRITDSERLTGTLMVARRVQELGGLADGLTLERARDRIWTLNSVEMWNLLTGTLGWTGDEYADWIGDAMCAAVLPPPSA